jgi:MFS family permease
MLPMMAAMAVFGSVSGPLTRYVNAKAQLLVGAALATLGSLAIAFQHDAEWKTAVAGGVFGIGLGLVYSSMINLIVQSVPRHQTGVASGMNTNIRTVGGAIGAAVVTSVITADLQPSGLPVESGYTRGFALLAGIAAAGAMVSLLVPVVRARTHVVPGPQAEAEVEVQGIG